jgi:hypothetical protein
MSYSLSSNFVPVEWYLAELWPLNLYFLQPKVIRPEPNSNLNCNSSRYSHRPNIKSIYQRTSKKSTDNLKFEQKIQVQIFCSNLKLSGLFFDVLWYIDLIFGMWLYLDELQFKFEFRSGRMIFGWVMTIELVFFVQILSCPYFFLTSFDILT